MLTVVVFRLRVRGRQNIPNSGGVVVLSNHQSHLDPVLVGLCFDRRLSYLARDTLFGFAPFRWLINSLDAIPINREGIGVGGLKECLKRLKAGEMLLIFPEGTRTRDGEVGEIKPGFLALSRRSKAALLPVGMEGAFDAWPRKNPLPLPAVVHIEIGEPLLPAQFADWSDEKLLAEIERRIKQCHDQAREYRDRVR
jgi:1-acyl-sn-glycerol-3-phosphate acyltransferase